MERRACELGIRSRVVFAGLRGNVPQLMQDAMDVFVFPSVFEGLGLVVLEAQAAGLPTLISTNVPADAVVIPELVTRISAQASAEEWADAALRRLGEPRPMSPSDALARIATSPFAIERSIVALIEFYGGY
jgi:glycosyltransferase involved in cell wall biosynthesis